MKSSSEIIKTVDKDFFNKIDTPEKLKNFIQSLLDVLCNENNLPKIEIIYDNFYPDFLGEFNLTDETIHINNTVFFEGFETFRKNNNLYFVYKSLDTILHEFRHYAQKKSKSKEISPKVKKSAKISKDYINNYDNIPAEVDARHYAYTKLAENEFFQNYSNYILNKEVSCLEDKKNKKLIKLYQKIAPNFKGKMDEKIEAKDIKDFLNYISRYSKIYRIKLNNKVLSLGFPEEKTLPLGLEKQYHKDLDTYEYIPNNNYLNLSHDLLIEFLSNATEEEITEMFASMNENQYLIQVSLAETQKILNYYDKKINEFEKEEL